DAGTGDLRRHRSDPAHDHRRACPRAAARARRLEGCAVPSAEGRHAVARGRGMTFTFSDEQQELRRGLRRFLEAKSTSAGVRRLMETHDGWDRAVWAQMAEQLGLPGLTIPEAFGGSGFGPVERLVVLEEMGRVLLCAPYFATAVLAVDALSASGDEAAQR